MERRDWSLKALKELNYIDSLNAKERGEGLIKWNRDYLTDNRITDFDLRTEDLEKLSELLYKSISFLKSERKQLKKQIDESNNLKKFLN